MKKFSMGGNMKKNEFIKKWGSRREKGKLTYMITNNIYILVIYLTVSIVYNFVKGNDFHQILSLIEFCALLSGGIIGSFIGWNKNEERYNLLLNKKY